MEYENNCKKSSEVLPRFEHGSFDSKSKVLTVTPQNPRHEPTNINSCCWATLRNKHEKLLDEL